MHPERLTYTFRFVVFRAAGDGAGFAQASGATADFLFCFSNLFINFFTHSYAESQGNTYCKYQITEAQRQKHVWGKKKHLFIIDSCTHIQKYF